MAEEEATIDPERWRDPAVIDHLGELARLVRETIPLMDGSDPVVERLREALAVFEEVLSSSPDPAKAAYLRRVVI